MRHLQEPFTLPVHGKLADEVNDAIISIKLHHCDLSKEPNQDAVKKAQERTHKLTFENIVDLLGRCRDTLLSVRENPIKY